MDKLRAYLADPQRSKLLRLILLAIIVFVLPLIVILAQQQQEIRQRASELTPQGGGGGEITIDLSPQSTSAYIGEPLSVDIILKAGTYNITGIDLIMSFNEAILPINKFVPNTQFNSGLINKIDHNVGSFRYAATNTNPSVEITGDIKLGTLVLEPKVFGQAQLSFLSTQITAFGKADSIYTVVPVGTYTVTTKPTDTPIPTLPPDTSIKNVNFPNDFSNTQGKNNLYYLAYIKSDKSYANTIWDGSKWNYKGIGSDRNFSIQNGSLSPSFGATTVVRWTTPQSGNINISGSFQRCCTETGDYNKHPLTVYSIVKNGQTIWDKNTEDNANISFAGDVNNISVSQGDNIEFWVDANNDSGWDSTNLNFAIDYVIPPTPTPTPNKISWKTPYASLEADNFYIVADGKKYYANTENVNIQSNPATVIGNPPYDYTTLEGIWQENGVEMRMFIYFSHFPGDFWKVFEIRTFDGHPVDQESGRWIYYKGFTGNTINTPYIDSVVDLQSDSTNPNNKYSGTIHFENLRLHPFFTNQPTSTPTPIILPGDANGDSVIDILDYNLWLSEFLGTTQTKKSDFNGDGKVDLLDFNIWRNAFSNPSFPTPSITSSKRIFITSSVYDGNLQLAGSKFGLGTATNGLDGADKICQGSANAAKLGGTWKAWLSTTAISAKSRLTHDNFPYMLTNGTQVAKDWSDLTDGTLLAAINMTENKTAVSSRNVWSNSWTDGTVIGFTASYSTCDEWTSSNAISGQAGDASSISSNWTYLNTRPSCNTNQSLYCFEQ